MRAALIASALDIESPGVDVNSGAGIIMAPAAVAAAGGVPSAALEVDSFTATDNPGDGDGFIVGGEGAALTVALTNLAPVTATNVTATLSTSSPYVKVLEPATRSYGTIASGAVVNVNGATPWAFTVASDAPCALTIDFTLSVTFAGLTTPQLVHSRRCRSAPIDITARSAARCRPRRYTATTGADRKADAATWLGVRHVEGLPRHAPGTCLRRLHVSDPASPPSAVLHVSCRAGQHRCLRLPCQPLQSRLSRRTISAIPAAPSSRQICVSVDTRERRSHVATDIVDLNGGRGRRLSPAPHRHVRRVASATACRPRPRAT